MKRVIQCRNCGKELVKSLAATIGFVHKGSHSVYCDASATVMAVPS